VVVMRTRRRVPPEGDGYGWTEPRLDGFPPQQV